MLINLINFLKKNLSYLIVIYIIVQLIYVLFFPVKFQSDSYHYYKWAEDCISAHSFYPAPQHLYSDFIIAPLYINLLVVILNIYNSTLSIGLMNILLNLLQLFLLYKITEIIFNKDTAQIFAALYIFYLNSLGLVITNYTELFFGALVFASIYFYLNVGKYSHLLAGIFAAASVGVRPLGWALLASYLIIYIYQIRKKALPQRSFLPILAGFILFIFSFGLFNQLHFGKFIFTSTSGPYNLIIGANDNATGAYNEKVFYKGNIGYIPNAERKTYIERGDIWESKAINWIESHPVKWISLLPVKTAYIFLWDDIAISPLMNLQDWDFFHIIKHIIIKKNINGLMPDTSFPVKIIYLALQIFVLVYYFLLLFLIMKGFFYLKKEKEFNYKNLLIIFYCIFIIMITIVVFGVPRLKYPFLIGTLPFAAYKIYSLMEKE